MSELDTATELASRDVSGRVVIVTGAGSGMGRATALLLAESGAAVACWDLNGDSAEETVGLASGGSHDGSGSVIAMAADVADVKSVDRAVAATREALGPIDSLVNNAGVSILAPLDSPEWPDAWERTLAVNLTGPANVLRSCLADLRRNGDGRVVNIASTEGLGATRYISPYTASKHGLIGFTRSAAFELAEAGVTVNCVCPGSVHTGMTAIIPDEHKERFARRRVPMRRYGEPVEVAHMTLSLLLPAASYTTGAVLAVDGGLTIQNT
ncbi:MAG: SDR family NAD(P)-dependent oxidoreductase [Microthrixaceae bacterium]